MGRLLIISLFNLNSNACTFYQFFALVPGLLSLFLTGPTSSLASHLLFLSSLLSVLEFCSSNNKILLLNSELRLGGGWDMVVMEETTTMGITNGTMETMDTITKMGIIVMMHKTDIMDTTLIGTGNNGLAVIVGLGKSGDL